VATDVKHREKVCHNCSAATWSAVWRGCGGKKVAVEREYGMPALWVPKIRLRWFVSRFLLDR
jgi:hypothetical protein